MSSVGDVSYNEGNIMLNYLPESTPPSVDLVPGGKPHDTTAYFVSFSGVRTTITALPILAVEAIDDQRGVACALEIAGGELRLIGGDGAVVADTYSAQADEHRILLRIDKSVDRCFVTITQVPQGTDGPPIKPAVTADAPFIDPGFDEMDRVRVRFLQDSDSAAHYFLGPMRITKRD